MVEIEVDGWIEKQVMLNTLISVMDKLQTEKEHSIESCIYEIQQTLEIIKTKQVKK